MVMDLTLEEAKGAIVGTWDLHKDSNEVQVYGFGEYYTYDKEGMESYTGNGPTDLERIGFTRSPNPYSLVMRDGCIYLERRGKISIEVCGITSRYMLWRNKLSFYVLKRR